MTNKTVNQRFQQHKGYVNNKKIDKATVLEVVAGGYRGGNGGGGRKKSRWERERDWANMLKKDLKEETKKVTSVEQGLEEEKKNVTTSSPM